MRFVIVLYLFIVADKSTGEFYGKCCKYWQIMEELEDFNYKCIADKTKRNSVFVPVANILENNSSTKCIDYSTNFYEFEIIENKIKSKKLLDGSVFPKCCPVGYIYVPKTHSCEPKGTFEHNFIQEYIVRVGVPQCRIVVDKIVALDVNKPGGDYCEDETIDGFIRRECKVTNDVCNDIRCIKKCCPDGQSFINGSNCYDTYNNGVDLDFSSRVENPEDSFAIVYNTTKCSGLFYLMSESRYIFSLLKNGDFQYWNNVSNSVIKESPTDLIGYCIEHANKVNIKGYFFFNCISKRENKAKFKYTKWPKVLSCIFLVLTIAIYVITKQTKKLFGRILINYCLSMLCMFALLTYAQGDLRLSDVPCQIVGFGIIFFGTVLFAWLNVMCCDIWLTFGSTKQSIGVYQRRKDLKKLLGYMAYGWGMPLVLTLIIYAFSIAEVLPDSIRPYVGTSACFIVYKPGNYATLIFVRIPHLTIQIVNAVLFVKTISYCLRIKNEIEKINDTTNERKVKFYRDKEKLFLIIKLAVIMGVTFIVDTVSGFVDMSELGTFWKNFEVVIDCINCLQGVYIFIIFVCKKSVYNDILKKLHIRRKDNYFSTNESFTSTTRISLKNGKNSVMK